MDGALDDMMGIITGVQEYIPEEPTFVDNIAPVEEDPDRNPNIAAIDERAAIDECIDERAAIDELLGIQPAAVNIEYRNIMIEVYPYDPESNMVNPMIRAEFKSETIFRETEIFTAPQITTITMEGFLSNVNCHEEQLIADLEADCEFVRIKCNFGEKRYPLYTPPVKVKKSNRGRKKKPPKERKRKKQGSGECFNSQTTFVMPSSHVKLIDGVVPSDAPTYKFKVFRTGKIQLPGLLTTTVIDDVMVLTSRLVTLLNFHLHTCEDDITKMSRLINLNPVMKNYKFETKLHENWILDLAYLREILQEDRARVAEVPAEGAEDIDVPKIFDIKYTRQETKLSVRFSTPVPGNLKKRVRVNIFKSGKINILGGRTKKTTDAICEYIHNLFLTHNRVFTKLGCADEMLEDNIMSLNGPITDIIPAPVLSVSHEEYLAAIAVVDRFHKQMIEEASEEFSALWPDY
jgi:hypothetical protein